jgi:hypothetical protein
MEKVKLLKEVAEAVEHLRNGFYDPQIIVAVLDGESYTHNPYRKHIEVLRDHFYLENANKLISALLSGYEIEQTPEERLREYYDNMLFANGDTYSDVIKHTLDILGIEIER